MKNFIKGELQHPVPETSMHDLLASGRVMATHSKKIQVAARPVGSDEVQHQIQKADERACSDPVHPDSLGYYQWLRQELCRWLRAPKEKWGVPQSRGIDAWDHLHDPVRPRALFQQTLARKVALWFEELRALLGRGVRTVTQQSATVAS